MTRLAGYDANGDELFDTDVLSQEEMAEDQRRGYVVKKNTGALVRALRRAQLRVDEHGYDQDGGYHPEYDGGAA